MPESKYLWYRWSESGKRHAVSLKTDDPSEAIKKIKEIQAGRLFARWERAEPLKTAATKAVEKYLVLAQKRDKKPMRPEVAKTVGYILRKYLTDMEVTDLRQITRVSIKEWITRLKHGSSKDTVHKYARTLKTFLKYLGRDKLVRGDLLDDFDVPEPAAIGRKNWLKVREVTRVIGESKDPALTFALFCGFHAGLRRNEIANARVHWFDLEAGLIHVTNDEDSGFRLKDSDNRPVPLTPEFKQFLQRFLEGKAEGDYVLRPNKKSGKWRYRADFSKAWYSQMKRCGVCCTIHDARRSFASNLVSHGVSIYKVARWLGDGVAVVEKSYGHLAPADRDIEALSKSSEV